MEGIVNAEHHSSCPSYMQKYLAKADMLGFGYRAAKWSRENKTPSSTGSGDYHTLYDLDTLRRDSQEFYRDNNIYTAAIERSLDFILGWDGFQLQAKTSNNDLNATIESYWNEWALQAEERGDYLGQAVRKIMRSVFVDGDVLVNLLDDTFQIIESEQIWSTSTIAEDGSREILGVKLSKTGRHLSYKIYDFNAYGMRDISKSTELPAEGVLFLASTARVSQTRGVPILVQSFPIILIINSIIESTAQAMQMQARLFGTVQSDQPKALGNAISKAKDQQLEGQTKRVMSVDMGNLTLLLGRAGQKIELTDNKIPSPQFNDTIKTLLRCVGMPLGLPYHYLSLDFSDSNYSSAKASEELAKRNFDYWQVFITNKFYKPVYKWFIDRLIREGKIQATPDIYKANFVTPRQPYFDVLKEAKGISERLTSGQTTYSECLLEQGRDIDDVLLEQQTEIEKAVAIVNKIKTANPELDLTWRDILKNYGQKTGTPATGGVNEDSEEGIEDKNDDMEGDKEFDNVQQEKE